MSFSTVQNPTSFDNSTRVGPKFYRFTRYDWLLGLATFAFSSCIPDGANVTIKIIYNGGDDIVTYSSST